MTTAEFQKCKEVKLLLIEDEPDQVWIIKSFLNKIEEVSYKVSEAENTESALDLVKENDFDCIIADYFLHDSNASEFFKSMHASVKDTLPPPCIMTTSMGDESVAVEALKQGFEDYIPKEKINDKSLHRSIDNSISKSLIKQELFKKEQDQKLLMKQLERSNDQMRRFVGIVAHDLRNPLGNITSICDLVNDLDDLDQIKQFCKLLQSSGQTAFELVNDLLDLTALEIGKVKVNPGVFNIKTLMEKVFSDHELLLAKKKITPIVQVNDDSDLRVIGDAKRIAQVFNNLVSNAIKFTPESGTIECFSSIEDKKVTCGVRDSGVGIPEKVIGKLFSKYEKTSTHGTNGEEGTGFGLPLAQELIKAHESEITVKSELGQGTTFSFQLPRAQA